MQCNKICIFRLEQETEMLVVFDDNIWNYILDWFR